MKTKWEILEARRDEYLAKAAEVQRELDDLEKTNCGGTCPRCNEYLRTEKDSAAALHPPGPPLPQPRHLPEPEGLVTYEP